MNIKEFKDFVKNERPKFFPKPFELVYDSFVKLEFHKQDSSYFLQNASDIIEQLRHKSWESFRELEQEFSRHVYKELVDKKNLETFDTYEAIVWFIENFSEQIYSFNLSTTQSRRSRAGTEFESIIELILMGTGISFDTQGSIGSDLFESKELAKLVDCVVPGAAEYELIKRNTSLISAKTTLRERWQEVGDEMARTRAREMYLVTLDDNVSDQTIQKININNIVLVTTKNIKHQFYQMNPHVKAFEDMLEELLTGQLTWSNYNYPIDTLKNKEVILRKQIDRYSNYPFVKGYYENQLDEL